MKQIKTYSLQATNQRKAKQLAPCLQQGNHNARQDLLYTTLIQRRVQRIKKQPCGEQPQGHQKDNNTRTTSLEIPLVKLPGGWFHRFC